MNVATKLSAYGLALLLLAGGAYAVGTAVGPLGSGPASAEQRTAADGHPGNGNSGNGNSGNGNSGNGNSDDGNPGNGHSGSTAGGRQGSAGGHADGHADTGDGHAHSDGAQATTEPPEGLAASSAGYTFVPVSRTVIPGVPAEFAFRIEGPDGAPVTDFVLVHDKLLHLILVRRDGSGYQHLHPEMDAAGTWRVPLTVAAGGSYRAFADFTAGGGKSVTLGVDLDAPGDYTPVAAEPTRTAQVGDYRVDLVGDLVPGKSSPLTLTVRRGGVPVTDLQPYLTAYGHLVALREGDLAYLHVHPVGVPGDGRTAAGPDIRFAAEVPSAGRYRLFLDFQHDGVVRTARFVVSTTRIGGVG